MFANLMTPERWQQVKGLFNSALELPLPERSRFLAKACSGDAALRSEVESLLSSHEQEGEFIDSPAYEVAANLLVHKSSDVAAGKNFGSYRILSILGRGGMGEVYLAEDGRLGRKVALKLLPSTFTNDPDRLARFEREARAASALNHPNILTIYEVGSAEGRQFIASEFVDGQTLRERQAKAPLKLREVLEVMIQVASALAAAHQAGIVHRDIKPENIMVRGDGYAKVVDFGLAKLTQAAKATTDTSLSTMLQVDTGTGVVMGTTAYMSPEQARGMELDARTDIWSLAVVFYELVSGGTPFKGNTQSDLIVSILERDPAPLAPTSVVPLELDWIVRKGLRKDREERYQTARELLSDLRALKQQLDFAAQIERTATPDPTPASGSGEVAVSERGQDITTAEPYIVSTAQIEQVTTGYPSAIGSRKTALALTAGLAVLLIAAAFGLYKLWPARRTVAPFQSMQITRLTNSGKVIDAMLSPDGKYLVYVLSDGKQSLWIRQVSTANDKEIVPAAAVGFFGIAFSPDGNDVYYGIKQNLDAGTLYRIPALGGTPRKILERIDSTVSFSPGGKQLVVVRGSFPNQGESALVIANADGGSERVLAVKKSPEMFSPVFFTGPSWSPDGNTIAAAVARVGSPSSLRSFAVADGKETLVKTSTPWGFIGRVEWLPDMSGLLVIAGEAVSTSQVWFVSYPDGAQHKITNDLASYRALGLASDATKFSTVQSSALVNIWVVPNADAKTARQLPTGNIGWYATGGNSVSWTRDGKLLVVSSESGDADIWLMDVDGSNRRQLTSKAGGNSNPLLSADGRFMVFASTRLGPRNIWRMDLDGNNPQRLTSGAVDSYPTLTPDGKWAFYTSLTEGKPTLWKVSTEGGSPVEVSNSVALAPEVSPDGKFVSYFFPEGPDPLAPPNRIAVIPIEGGPPVKIFAFDLGRSTPPHSQWTADSRSIIYPVSGSVSNLWSQSLDGGPPKQITDFKDSLILSFAWSPDWKTLACSRGVLTRDAVLISDVR